MNTWGRRGTEGGRRVGAAACSSGRGRGGFGSHLQRGGRRDPLDRVVLDHAHERDAEEADQGEAAADVEDVRRDDQRVVAGRGQPEADVPAGGARRGGRGDLGGGERVEDDGGEEGGEQREVLVVTREAVDHVVDVELL